MKTGICRKTGTYWLAMLLGLGCGVANAATLDGSQNLSSYPPIALEGGTQNVVTNGAGFYNFADRLGDGSSNAVTPSGLNLTNRYLNMNNVSYPDLRLKLNGANLTATTGYLGDRYTGDVYIYDVGAIAMGDGYLRAGEQRALYIGQDGVAGPRAGSIQVNGFFATGAGYNSRITVYGSGDVLMRNAAGVATNVNTTTYNGGPITILHDGTFLANKVLANGAGSVGGVLLFNGDVLGDGASGTFTAASLDNHDTYLVFGAYNTPVGSITISNYTAVTVGSIDTRKLSGDAFAGSVLITGIVNNVQLTGDINLLGRYALYTGSLKIYAGGTITVNNLNLSNVNYAAFDASGASYITGLLTGTNGAAATNLGNIGTALRTPSGGKIYYTPSQNPGLGGQTIPLANLAGTPGAGGVLRPKPQGTVVWFE